MRRANYLIRHLRHAGGINSSNSPSFSQKKTAHIKQVIQNIPNLSSTSPVIFEEAPFRYRVTKDSQKQNETPLRILGVTSTDGTHWTPQVERIIDDNILTKLTESQHPTVILSAELFDKLYPNSTPSDRALSKKIWLQRTDRTNVINATHEEVELEVIGVFRLGIHKVADTMLITNVTTAQKILGMGDYVSMLGINLAQPFLAERTAKSIEEKLGKEDVLVFQWLQAA
ncbi:MAG: hypothetical protein D3905_12190, partial [Candidatus Electrothrix sp. AS4_5]|nr:hypothetical protein [Candidatus Electrothrix gigas]